jgi:hypothetical protein
MKLFKRNMRLFYRDSKEAQAKLRGAVEKKTYCFYRYPPRLLPRFQPIDAIPIATRLSYTSEKLMAWHHQIEQQILFTGRVFNKKLELSQLQHEISQLQHEISIASEYSGGAYDMAS